MIYVAGLAALLSAKTPTRAVATLYFGILGSVGHGLVALTFYVGLPMLLALAAHDPAVAANGWNAFTIVTSGFQALGNMLLGLMLLVAGWAIISRKALWAGVGWVGVLAGIVSLLGVVTSETPLAILGVLAYLPTFILVMTFDIWVGILLWKSTSDPRTTEALSA
jgi:hypothetical protein